ncbi:MAG: argininosuccinate lyase, partial [Abditibacteriota bacterium]|nr:argininosuccinate lyase [Abditibacteriota bacterium]
MSEKLWGGRFSKGMADVVEKFTESVSYDCRLFPQDIRGSIAHAKMLGKQGIIPAEDSAKIVKGLEAIYARWEKGEVVFDTSAEDVHMNAEKMLFAEIGAAAGRLHTARSRNDQVCTDVRLYMMDEIDAIAGLIDDFCKVIVDAADRYKDAVLPGYTHMQHAQPVLLGHYFMAYCCMLERDKARFTDCRKRVAVLPLGSGALAGTTFPIDRDFVARELGFDSVSENSLDSVADRDFISEFLSAASILMIHLSRFAEETVIWNTSEFGFVTLDDSVTTGSSIMPQKKNPDVAELVRGKSARVIADLMSLLTLQKGLPMTYNRDLQEDKEPLFDAVDTVKLALSAFALMLDTAVYNVDIMYKKAGESYST